MTRRAAALFWALLGLVIIAAGVSLLVMTTVTERVPR